MTKPLISDSQMASLQKVAIGQFETTATIVRPPFDADETGDGQGGKPKTIGTVVGWLTSAPSAEGQIDSGSFVTANTYRWNCAVGTDIRPRDFLDIGSNRYVVTDSTADETWPTMLSVSLRLRE